MTSIFETIYVASYNCCGWNSSIPYVKMLLKDFDLLLIQEHWLFIENLSLLNINSDFSSFGISGMESTVFLTGRPYGGCGFLIRKNLLPFTGIITSVSKRFCALLLTINWVKTLVINVYLPTNYGNMDSEQLYRESLAELKGFVDSQSFDNLIIAGYSNVDFHTHLPHGGTFS